MARSEMRLSGSPSNTGFAEGKAVQCPSARHLPEWLHGNISRRHAEELLQGKPLGCFLVRFSESRNGYTLSYRGPGQFRHFMIDVMPDSRCIISGDSRVHKSLQELVSYHTQVAINPYIECLTVPCSPVKAGNSASCSLSPELGKERQTSPPGCSAAANISPLTPRSASPMAAKPRLPAKPPKFQVCPKVPPPLPDLKGRVFRLAAHHKPAIARPIPVAASDDSRRPVKKLYPSIQTELNALLLGNQLPTSEVAAAFHLPAATLPRHNSEVRDDGDGAQRYPSTEGQEQRMVPSQDQMYCEIPTDHSAHWEQDQPSTRFPQVPSLGSTPEGNATSSPAEGSEGVGRLKGQAAPLFNIKEMISKFSDIKHLVNRVKHPEPQRNQPSSPGGFCTSAANNCPATRQTNLYSPLDKRRQDQSLPQQVRTLHAPSDSMLATQPSSHTPLPSTNCAKAQFAEESPCHGRDKLNTCTEGQAEECFGDSGYLPEEYLIPPPYAPGYNPS